MSSNSEQIDEQQVRSFLLGELSESKRVELEERFFKDDSYYRQMLAIQEELTDDYIQNSLSSRERESFVQNFLRSSLRMERVEFATALSAALGTAESVEWKKTPSFLSRVGAFFRLPSPFSLVTTAASLLLFAAVIWLVVQNNRLNRDAEQLDQHQKALIRQNRDSQAESASREQQLQSEIATLREQGSQMQGKIDEKQRELDSLKSQRSATSKSASNFLSTFVLSPGLSRGPDEPEKLIIASSTRTVNLQLNLEREESYREYFAEIRTARGNLVWSRYGLLSRKTTQIQSVSVKIPAALLSTGEYEISLKGVSGGQQAAIGYYYIIALRK